MSLADCFRRIKNRFQHLPPSPDPAPAPVTTITPAPRPRPRQMRVVGRNACHVKLPQDSTILLSKVKHPTSGDFATKYVAMVIFNPNSQEFRRVSRETRLSRKRSIRQPIQRKPSTNLPTIIEEEEEE